MKNKKIEILAVSITLVCISTLIFALVWFLNSPDNEGDIQSQRPLLNQGHEATFEEVFNHFIYNPNWQSNTSPLGNTVSVGGILRYTDETFLAIWDEHDDDFILTHIFTNGILFVP